MIKRNTEQAIAAFKAHCNNLNPWPGVTPHIVHFKEGPEKKPSLLKRLLADTVLDTIRSAGRPLFLSQ